MHLSTNASLTASLQQWRKCKVCQPPYHFQELLPNDMSSAIHCSGQTYGELTAMEESVSATLASGEGDMDYWEAVLKRLKIQKVCVRVCVCMCVHACVCVCVCVCLDVSRTLS
jgi:hypothetical protein